MNMKMSIKDLPKKRREEIIVLEILRRNYREQKQSANKSGQVVLEIPVSDVDIEDGENVSPQTFCRVVYSFKEKDIAVRVFDKGDVQTEIAQSYFPDEVVFCTVTVQSNFKEIYERLLHDAYGKSSEINLPTTTLDSSVIVFDDNEASINIGGKSCKLPAFKNEHFFCRAMFAYPAREPVDWSIIFKQMAGELRDEKKNLRTVQDTMYAVNNRVMEVIGTEDALFEWDNKSVKRCF